MSNIDKDIETLKTHDAFIRFLAFIEILRNECIAEMHESSSEKIQQISGRILSYDQILEITDFEKNRHLLNAI